MVKRILILAGGSGGHLYPALAVADILIEKGFKVYLFTSKKRPSGINFDGLEIIEGYSVGWDRSISGMFKTIWSLTRDFMLSIRLLKEINPDLVLGMGGYVSVSPIFVSIFFNIPKVLHEQNIIPGLANKILALFVDKIFVSFPETKFNVPRTKLVYTGLPLRKELYQIKYSNRRDKFTVLVMGGSQGARIINNVVLEIVERRLLKDIRFIHITGPKEFERLKDRIKSIDYPYYEVYSYVNDIWRLYGEADLVISRAGASSVIEFATVSLPAILIPYKGAEGHQCLNAKWLADSGGAIIIEQDHLSALSLAEAILDIIKSDKISKLKESIARLSVPNGSYTLAEEIIKIIQGGSYDRDKQG